MPTIFPFSNKNRKIPPFQQKLSILTAAKIAVLACLHNDPVQIILKKSMVYNYEQKKNVSLDQLTKDLDPKNQQVGFFKKIQ